MSNFEHRPNLTEFLSKLNPSTVASWVRCLVQRCKEVGTESSIERASASITRASTENPSDTLSGAISSLCDSAVAYHLAQLRVEAATAEADAARRNAEAVRAEVAATEAQYASLKARLVEVSEVFATVASGLEELQQRSGISVSEFKEGMQPLIRLLEDRNGHSSEEQSLPYGTVLKLLDMLDHQSETLLHAPEFKQILASGIRTLRSWGDSAQRIPCNEDLPPGVVKFKLPPVDPNSAN